jgi:Uma2 family endonuclease
MTIKEMNDRRKELGYSYKHIAELSGVPVGTVQKVLGGITKSPRYETLKALEQALRPIEDDWYYYDWKRDASVRESLTYAGKKQGMYTVEDYYVLSENERMELIDGVIYDMSSPTTIHQVIAGKIYYKLENYIMGKKGQCVPIISPIDVQLDCDDRTILQPDVIVVCDRDKIKKGVVYGGPDFVVEVISPSTRSRDKNLKLDKYMRAGVREYWIVDPKKKNIVVYADDGADDYDIFVYTFEHEVPVRIFDNECKIDFKEIYDYIAFMYEK